MKTIEEIIRSRPIFLNDWNKTKRFGVLADFFGVYLSEEEYKKPDDENVYRTDRRSLMRRVIKNMKNCKILFASYVYKDYSGDAWVLFSRDGKLYEVNGSHCSCHGLEGQWTKESEEEVILTEIENRLVRGTFGTSWNEDVFRSVLGKFLGIRPNK